MKSLPLALLLMLSARPQGETSLRRTLKEGSVDTYTVIDKVQQTVTVQGAQIPQAISTTKTYVLRTKAVDAAAGSAAVEATTTFEKIEGDGGMVKALGDKPAPTTQTGKIDVRGRLTLDKGPGGESLQSLLGGTQATAAAGTLLELPEKPVKIGDKWDIVIPKGPLVFDKDQRIVATLVGEREVEGVAVWVVSIRGVVRTAVDSSKVPGVKPLDTPMGATSVKIQGEVDLTGEGLIEKATGRTVSMESKGPSKSTIELVEIGFTLASTGTLESSVKLKKA